MTLLERTAEALYLAATSESDDPLPYEKLPSNQKGEFEKMAVAALTIAFREPLLEEA